MVQEFLQLNMVTLQRINEEDIRAGLTARSVTHARLVPVSLSPS